MIRASYTQVKKMRIYYIGKSIFATLNGSEIDKNDIVSDKRRMKVLRKIKQKRRTFVKY
jgi:hypothetical protein